MSLIATYNCKTLYKAKVRPDPSTANATDLAMPAGTTFQVSEIVPDRLDPFNTAKKWGHIIGGVFNGLYTALEYPGNPVPISSYTLIETTPPTEPPVAKYPDMLIVTPVVDGLSYPSKNYIPE